MPQVINMVSTPWKVISVTSELLEAKSFIMSPLRFGFGVRVVCNKRDCMKFAFQFYEGNVKELLKATASKPSIFGAVAL
jgi:hypothetical protein